MKKIVLVIVFFIVSQYAFPQQMSKNIDTNDIPNFDYGEVVANEIAKPKHVQIKPMKIDDFKEQSFTIVTFGYSEIRVFAELYKDDEKEYLQKNSQIRLIFVNEITGLGSPFKTITFKNEVNSMIDAWAIEKIYGRKTKIILAGDNIPNGKYTLHFSYYLLP